MPVTMLHNWSTAVNNHDCFEQPLQPYQTTCNFHHLRLFYCYYFTLRSKHDCFEQPYKTTCNIHHLRLLQCYYFTTHCCVCLCFIANFVSFAVEVYFPQLCLALLNEYLNTFKTIILLFLSVSRCFSIICACFSRPVTCMDGCLACMF